MAVLITAEVKGQTREGYDATLAAVSDLVKDAPGFILHSSHPTEDGWRVIEVWESKVTGDRFFAKHVVPNLPPGIHPKRTVKELHSLLTPIAAVLG